MLNIHDIKIGDNFIKLKKEIYKDENEDIILSTLPSFCNSEYKEIYDYNNKNDKLYIRADKQDIIVDITDKFNVAVNVQEATNMLNFILDN